MFFFIIMLEDICFCYYCKICYPTYFLALSPAIFAFYLLFYFFLSLSGLHLLSSLCLTLHWQSSCSAHQVLGQAGTRLAAKKLALALWSEKFILLHLYCPTVWLSLIPAAIRHFLTLFVWNIYMSFSPCVALIRWIVKSGHIPCTIPLALSLATLIITLPATWEAGPV